MNCIADHLPFFDGTFQSISCYYLDGSIKGNPGHHFRVSKMLLWASYFPDSMIGLLPATLEMLHHGAEDRPRRFCEFDPVFQRKPCCIHELSEDVELNLLVGGVPDPNRARV